MAGRAGTPRFGINPTEHDGYKAGPDGVGYVDMPDGTKFTELHYAYNPAQYSREMGDVGTSGGQAPARCYYPLDRQADYMSNHDGYMGGMTHNLQMDERKVLDNTIYAVKVKYEADDQNIAGTSGKFD